MSEITRAPLVACDCCGVQAAKRINRMKWQAPDRWGQLSIPPKHWGTYPDHIAFTDVCPECIAEIHDAVSAAIERRKKKANIP